MTPNQTLITPNRKRLTGLIILFILLIGAAVAYFVIKNQSSGSDGVDEIKTSEAKVVSVEKLSVENTDYNLLSTSYPTDAVILITNFEEEGDKWQGGGVTDSEVYYEGASSLSLISIDHSETPSYLKKDLDLTNLEFVEFMAHVSDANAFETMTLDFGDLESKNYYRYTMSNLNIGWNMVQIPKKQFVPFIEPDSDFSWQKVQKVQFNLTSRVDAVLMVRLDMLRAINNSYSYMKDWKVAGDRQKLFLSLYPQGESRKLLARTYGVNQAILGENKNLRDFVFTASVSPLTQSRIGLFARGNYNNSYGYYFLINGNRDNRWQIIKNGRKGWSIPTEIVQGDIGNDVFQSNQEYWLRVEARGNIMEFFLSFDNETYLKLGEFRDTEFRSGGVGIAILDNGFALFDNIMIKKL